MRTIKSRRGDPKLKLNCLIYPIYPAVLYNNIERVLKTFQKCLESL